MFCIFSNVECKKCTGLRKDHRPPPLSALPQLVTATKADIQKNGLVGPMVGHVGDETLLWIIFNIIDVNPHNPMFKTLFWIINYSSFLPTSIVSWYSLSSPLCHHVLIIIVISGDIIITITLNLSTIKHHHFQSERRWKFPHNALIRPNRPWWISAVQGRRR